MTYLAKAELVFAIIYLRCQANSNFFQAPPTVAIMTSKVRGLVLIEPCGSRVTRRDKRHKTLNPQKSRVKFSKMCNLYRLSFLVATCVLHSLKHINIEICYIKEQNLIKGLKKSTKVDFDMWPMGEDYSVSFEALKR